MWVFKKFSITLKKKKKKKKKKHEKKWEQSYQQFVWQIVWIYGQTNFLNHML